MYFNDVCFYQGHKSSTDWRSFSEILGRIGPLVSNLVNLQLPREKYCDILSSSSKRKRRPRCLSYPRSSILKSLWKLLRTILNRLCFRSWLSDRRRSTHQPAGWLLQTVKCTAYKTFRTERFVWLTTPLGLLRTRPFTTTRKRNQYHS